MSRPRRPSLIAAALVLPAPLALSRAVGRSHREGRRLATRIAVVAIGLGLGYRLLMALAERWLLVRLFGQEFSTSADLIWPMAAMQLPNVAGVSFTLLLMAGRRGRASFAVGALFAGASLACAAGFAYRYGVEGAAWGMAAGAGVGIARDRPRRASLSTATSDVHGRNVASAARAGSVTRAPIMPAS